MEFSFFKTKDEKSLNKNKTVTKSSIAKEIDYSTFTDGFINKQAFINNYKYVAMVTILKSIASEVLNNINIVGLKYNPAIITDSFVRAFLQTQTKQYIYKNGNTLIAITDSIKVEDKNKFVSRKEYVVVSDNVTQEQINKRLPDAKTEGNKIVQMNRRICFYNYDMCFKDEKTIGREFLKQSKARFKKTGSDWGQTEKEALDYFVKMQIGRLKQGWSKVKLEEHPKHIQEKVKNIKPDQLGFNLFGEFKK